MIIWTTDNPPRRMEVKVGRALCGIGISRIEITHEDLNERLMDYLRDVIFVRFLPPEYHDDAFHV